MRGATDFEARQRARRRRANLDAALAVFWTAAGAAALLWVRSRFCAPDSPVRLILLILAVADAALIVPIFMVRHQRFKEIEGGEEDEARNY